jgi:hypothetical protein
VWGTLLLGYLDEDRWNPKWQMAKCKGNHFREWQYHDVWDSDGK